MIWIYIYIYIANYCQYLYILDAIGIGALLLLLLLAVIVVAVVVVGVGGVIIIILIIIIWVKKCGEQNVICLCKFKHGVGFFPLSPVINFSKVSYNCVLTQTFIAPRILIKVLLLIIFFSKDNMYSKAMKSDVLRQRNFFVKCNFSKES